MWIWCETCKYYRPRMHDCYKIAVASEIRSVPAGRQVTDLDAWTDHELQNLSIAVTYELMRRNGERNTMQNKSEAAACSTLAGKWSISTNGENYHSQFDTVEDAIAEGKHHGGTFYVGQCAAPIPPEECFDGWSVLLWLENSVYEHDDYAGEWAEDSVKTTKEQRAELANEIRPLIAAWLDRNKLRPTHWNIDPVSVQQIDE